MSNSRSKRSSLSGGVEVMPPVDENHEGNSIGSAVDRGLRLEARSSEHNAFAEKELQTHRARLAGNAFYQQGTASFLAIRKRDRL